jgi:hypothetical protein
MGLPISSVMIAPTAMPGGPISAVIPTMMAPVANSERVIAAAFAQ